MVYVTVLSLFTCKHSSHWRVAISRHYEAAEGILFSIDVALCEEQNNTIIFNFVDTPRNFIIAKLSIRKPGSSSVLIKSDLF